MQSIKTQIFEAQRKTLEGIAYRMLGSLSDAADIVQDTYIKWQAQDTDNIKDSRAWLITVCSRLALNELQSARVKREAYFGVWLPEPLINEQHKDTSEQLELDESISVALLLALEKLSPSERATYILHDVFNYPFDEIADIVNKTNATCRQLATRARKRIQEEKPRFNSSSEEHKHLLDSFMLATRDGKMQQLEKLLANAVELYSDGGGKVQALPEVLQGSQTIANFFTKIWQQYDHNNVSIEIKPHWFNGSPGILIFEDNNLATAITLDIHEGKIQRIYAIRNPDKLVSFSY
jgi:RNA polymerase sigma-70 factor, ECF subfamily